MNPQDLMNSAGLGNLGISTIEERQQAELHRQLMMQIQPLPINATPSVYNPIKDDSARRLVLHLREISNGFMLTVGDREVYCKDLPDVGPAVMAAWAARVLKE